MKEVIQMQGLAELRATARKAAIDILIGVATAAATELALQAIRGGRETAPEQAPIRIEIVVPAQKGADTALALPTGMEKKRFPARTYVVPIAAQKQMARPMLMK